MAGIIGKICRAGFRFQAGIGRINRELGQAGGIRLEGRRDIGDLLEVLGPHGAKQALIISKGIDKNLLFILKRIRNITGDVKVLHDLPTVQEIHPLDYNIITEEGISGYLAHLIDMKAKLLIEGTSKVVGIGGGNIAKINATLESYEVHQALTISHERFEPPFLQYNDKSISKMKDLFLLLWSFRIAERINDVRVFSENEHELATLGLEAIAGQTLPFIFVHASNLQFKKANLLIVPNEGREQ